MSPMKQDFWTKVKNLAEGLGVATVTFRQWRYRGCVPAKWHYPLVEEGKKNGVRLSIRELNQKRESA